MRGGGWSVGRDKTLYDYESLVEAEQTGEMADITRLGIGPRLYASLPRDELLARLAGFPKLAIILLADDWIADGDMAAVRRAFEEALPEVQFLWTDAGLTGGKHGR
ncbi:MAG: hypothetical protein MEQ07_06055 [Aquimonas sp.]|nr:hypothetical protein [Aquimonas sp.]